MITLQFVTQRWSVASAFIRYGTWCTISHVDLVLPDGSLLGARTDHTPGVQIRPKGYANFSLVIQADYDFDAVQTATYIAWCTAQVGKPYDRRGIIDYLAHRRRDWRDESAWYCSELQARASEIAGRPFLDFSYIGCFKIDPRDLILSDHKLGTRYVCAPTLPAATMKSPSPSTFPLPAAPPLPHPPAPVTSSSQG